MRLFYFLFVFVILFSCNQKEKKTGLRIAKKEIQHTLKDTLLVAKTFDFPVGKPNAKGYYNAQEFGKNNHLGDDWNSIKGGNSDLGHPIFSIANGYVKAAKDYGGGWGNVIRIVHYLPNNKKVESLYAHCDTILVEPNSWVKKGDKIGTIGTANGTYLAHLHLEIRNDINLPIGGGYSSNTKGYVDPTKFIKNHREIKE